MTLERGLYRHSTEWVFMGGQGFGKRERGLAVVGRG
jgi:hypothetical protein